MMDVPAATAADTQSRETVLRQTAENLETAFLSEMLKSAGFGMARDAFGGGTGEAQFTSFLRDEQARALVKAGGFGLAESIFEALKRGEPDAA